MPESRPARLALVGVLVTGMLVALVAGGALLFRLATRPPAKPGLATLAALPSITPPKPALALQASAPPATPTPMTRATLPPTWTITPTREPSATPTPSATSLAATRPPTLSPEQLAQTYWEGDGSGSMWDYQFDDGSYMRFSVLPVNIWVGPYGGTTLTQAHETAIQEALAQVAQVVPVQRVTNRGFAHLTIWLMNDTEFERNARCSDIHLAVGCAMPIFTDVGILLNTIWLRVTDQHFATTLLHEVTHGLGVLVHSPHSTDLMYAYQTGQPPRYTARDLNTLRALYSAPAFAPRGN